MTPFKKMFNYRYLLHQSLKSELRQRYAGSLLGSAWMVLYPVFMFLIYILIYLYIFKVKPSDMSSAQYVVYVLSGLISFLSFSEALTTGSLSLITRKSLLVNTMYPSEFIPFQSVLCSHVNIVIGIGFLMLVNLVSFGVFYTSYWAVFFLFILQIMFVAGIIWILSIISLVMKDIVQILPLLIMLLMIVSPIAYSPAMVPSTLKFILWLNPFSYFVRAYQDIFVFNVVGINFMVVTVLSFSSFFMGYSFFNKVKEAFYDYI